jgi:hypothetical protein
MNITIVILAAAVSAPLAATAIVSLASVREDRNWSLAAAPHRKADAIARRIVGFHTECRQPWPRPHEPSGAPPPQHATPPDANECHAVVTL